MKEDSEFQSWLEGQSRDKMKIDKEDKINKLYIEFEELNKEEQEKEEQRVKRELEMYEKEKEMLKIIEEEKKKHQLDLISHEMEMKNLHLHENEELVLNRIKLQAEYDKERILEMISLTFTHITNFVTSFLSNQEQVLITIFIVISITTSYYIIKEVASLLRSLLELYMGKPKLVRETSYTQHWIVRILKFGFYK